VKYTVLGVALLTLGCTETWDVQVSPFEDCEVPPDKTERLLQFVVACAEAANPKSDEEGEDLVSQCERTGGRALQVCTTVFKANERGDYNWVPCSKLLSSRMQHACISAGWREQ
jgi:hypothetical protein